MHKLVILAALVFASVAIIGLRDLEHRYAMEDRV